MSVQPMAEYGIRACVVCHDAVNHVSVCEKDGHPDHHGECCRQALVRQQLALAARMCSQAAENMAGFVLIGITADGTRLMMSTAAGSAVIIGELATVISYLDARLAAGVDVQADMIAGKAQK